MKACGSAMTVHHGGNPDTHSTSAPVPPVSTHTWLPLGQELCSVRLVFKACTSHRKGPLGLHRGASWPSEGHSHFPTLEEKMGDQTSGIVSSWGTLKDWANTPFHLKHWCWKPTRRWEATPLKWELKAFYSSVHSIVSITGFPGWLFPHT